MTINIGGQQSTEAEVIAAIAASIDADHTHIPFLLDQLSKKSAELSRLYSTV